MTEEWKTSETGYPEPTVILIDENTDLNKIHEQARPLDATSPKVRRVLIGIKMFKGELDFQAWQRETPREIFEITPMVYVDVAGNPKPAIFVTHADGVIE